MDNRFDLAVIGGGPGGYVAAIYASKLGLKVALIEEREMGGTCLNRGCIPTKSILHSAEVFQIVKNSGKFGILAGQAKYDYEKISLQKDAVINKLRYGVEYLVKNSGCKIINGKGTIKDKNTIEVRGKETQIILAEKIIIATGSSPARPPIKGINGNKVLDSDSVLSLTACPDRIVIIGGGVIGIEFATIFNALGKEVSVIEMEDSILPGVDTEISMLLWKSLEQKGIKIYTGARVSSIESNTFVECKFEYSGALLKEEGDIVVAATGRKPNSTNLGLENLGIRANKGFIEVNKRMETRVKGIYAIGDVTGKVLLAHVASAQGLVAAANASGKNKIIDYSIVPGCIYTSPEIATVGLTEAEAKKRGYRIKIGRFPVNANGKSLIMGEKEGMVKVITDATTGEILGAHIMGPRATDMISEISVAMKLESTIEELADTIHPHPTLSEMIMEASHDVNGLCVHKP